MHAVFGAARVLEALEFTRFGSAAAAGVTTRLERTGPRTHRLVVRFENAGLAAKGAPDLGVLFTQRIAHPKLAAGAPDGTVLADDFILVRAPKPAAGKTELTVDFEEATPPWPKHRIRPRRAA